MNRVFFEKNDETFKRLSDNSVDLIITSPPYFVEQQYEKSMSYKEYYDMMQLVFINTYRVLKPGGYACFNFGDYFNSRDRFYKADVPSCYPASINYFHWGVEIAGLDLQAQRIWAKNLARVSIGFVCNKHPRNAFDFEHVWTFYKGTRNRKDNIKKKPPKYDQEFIKDRSLSQKGVIGFKSDGKRWATKANKGKFKAAFPVELPEWCIKVYSKNEGDLVYDPFIGSGTTAEACLNLNRRYIGSENDKETFNLALEKIGQANNKKDLKYSHGRFNKT